MHTARILLVADRYRLLHPLGEGGMGRVWRARDEVLHRDVAIKELVAPPGLTDDERRELQERSMREARAVARLNHPHVVRIFDVVDMGDGDPWIVMEYLPGRSLHDTMQATATGTLPARQVAHIGLQILQALQAAHELGVVHRDVKPGNILLTDDGRAVLTDFGIAAVPGDPFVTRTGLLLGSPAYLAPERARHASTSTAADLWSLGATLYAATEGGPPFARATTMETLSALASEPVPPPQHAGPLTPVLTGLLQKDPEQRIDAATAQQLLREAMVEPKPKPEGPRQRNRILLPAAVLATLAMAATAIFVIDRLNGPARENPAAPATSGAQSQAASPAPVPSSVPSAVPSQPPPPSPTAAGFQLPAGWQMRDDGSTGFKVPVPDGWQFGRDEDGRPLWQDPATKRLLLIDQTRTPKPDPVQDWRNNESLRRGGYRDYQRIRIEEVSYWDKAADWEFTYTLDGTPVHVLNRGFITAPDQAYSIYWRTPIPTWEDNRDELQVVLDGFVPARS